MTRSHSYASKNEPRRSWLWRPDFHSGERGSNPRRFANYPAATDGCASK